MSISPWMGAVGPRTGGRRGLRCERPARASAWANAASGTRQAVASAMAPSDLRVIMSTPLLVPSHQRKKNAPVGLFDPCTCEWQFRQPRWFASAALKKTLPGPRNGIAMSRRTRRRCCWLRAVADSSRGRPSAPSSGAAGSSHAACGSSGSSRAPAGVPTASGRACRHGSCSRSR